MSWEIPIFLASDLLKSKMNSLTNSLTAEVLVTAEGSVKKSSQMVAGKRNPEWSLLITSIKQASSREGRDHKARPAENLSIEGGSVRTKIGNYRSRRVKQL